MPEAGASLKIWTSTLVNTDINFQLLYASTIWKDTRLARARKYDNHLRIPEEDDCLWTF